MEFKQIKHISVGFLIVLLTSCDAWENFKNPYHKGKNISNNSNPQSNTNNNSNIVKVLNRVRCPEFYVTNYPACPATISEKVWQSCLDKGYTTSTPNKEIISARDIKELTQLTGAPDSAVYNEGYCIGSEYITR